MSSWCEYEDFEELRRWPLLHYWPAGTRQALCRAPESTRSIHERVSSLYNCFKTSSINLEAPQLLGARFLDLSSAPSHPSLHPKPTRAGASRWAAPVERGGAGAPLSAGMRARVARWCSLRRRRSLASGCPMPLLFALSSHPAAHPRNDRGQGPQAAGGRWPFLFLPPGEHAPVELG